MGTLDSNLVNIEADTKDANVVKDMVLKQLKKDKLISEDEYNTYSIDWHILIYKSSWFKKLNPKDPQWFYKFLKFSDEVKVKGIKL